jgi:uncharacterized protein (DUF305 family)
MDRRVVGVLVTALVVAVLGVGAAVALGDDGRDRTTMGMHARAGTHGWGGMHDRDGAQGRQWMDGRDGMSGWHGMNGRHGMRGWYGVGAMIVMMQQARVHDEAGYLALMIPHHREAIRAARELSRSDRPWMRRLGRSIVTSQSRQVRRMRHWLATWYGERPAASYHPMMRDLHGLDGNALDRAFLQDMVRHHMTAVMMSQQLLMHGLARHRDVARLARAIRDDQRSEIRQMMHRLATWSRP